MEAERDDPRLLSTGHYVGLKFDKGWWFLKILGTEYVELKPWILLNDNDNRATIPADTAGSDKEEIEDVLGNKLLEPNRENRNTVFQILYGVAPSRMQVFELFGRDRNKNLENYDQPGDPATYVSGNDSPYDNPSGRSETFYVEAMAPLRIQAYNPMDESFEAKTSFHVNKLHYGTVKDKGLMKAMLQGQQRARLHTMGGGIDGSEVLDIPNWVEEAFGEHIYTTKEILEAESKGRGDGLGVRSGADLQGGGNSS